MKKLDLLNRDTVRLIGKFENRILEIIDNQDEMTRSDLQGAVGAIVIDILKAGAAAV